MSTETFPHRCIGQVDDTEFFNWYCRCGKSPAEYTREVAMGTWGSDCPAALREALETARMERDEARGQEEYQRLVNALLCKPTEVAPLSNQDINDPRVGVRSSLMTMAIKLMAAAVRTNPNAINYGAWKVAADPDALTPAEPGSPEDIDGWDIHVACVRPGGKGPADLVADVKQERDAALARVAELERTTPGPHITPALMRRVEALGFVPGSGEPVGWLVAHAEELEATLANERGEGEPPSEGWTSVRVYGNGNFSPGWRREDVVVARFDVEFPWRIFLVDGTMFSPVQDADGRPASAPTAREAIRLAVSLPPVRRLVLP